MADLILPGTIPGLLRRGSPVVFVADEHIDSCIFYVGCRAVADDVTSGEPVVRGKHIFPGAVALDLTDATGRAHAAWWLEDQAPRWRTMMAGRLGGEMLRLLECVESHKFLGSDEREARGRARLTLHGLDPNDPSRLPDGSRWVDAEALRRVVLHVAGVANG